MGRKYITSGRDLSQRERAYPILAPIVNGWAARGPGWAVHGRTQEEAVQLYREAEERHREIDERPFWYERIEAREGSR